MNRATLPQWVFGLSAFLFSLIPVGSNATVRDISSPTFVSHISDSMSDYYHVIRKMPDGFHVVEEGRFIATGNAWRRNIENGRWERLGRSGPIGTVLQSDDRQCIVTYSYILDIQFYSHPAPENFGGFYPEASLRHRNWIMLELLSMHNGQENFRFEDHVTTFSGKEARENFNADSVFLFDIPIQPLEQDGETYTHCTRMYLTKKDRATLDFVWFFTDEGKERKWDYIRRMDKKVWYKEDEEDHP